MSTSTKPAIIIIPGSFCPLSFYTSIISELKCHGYSVYGIELETVGRRDKAPGMYDDAAAVASLVSQLADEGKEVVLVAHSYGGIVACEAAKGLAQSLRGKEGNQGGVVRIIFVTAVVASEGQSLMDVFDATGRLDFIRVGGEYMVIDPAGCAPVNYSDLPAEEAFIWASNMKDHAAASFGQSLTYAAYRDIAVSYLFCEEDKVVIPEMQNKFIEGMESEMGGRSVDRHPISAGHCINLSQPKTVATVVRRVLGDTV